MLPSIISKVASVKISPKEGILSTSSNDNGDESNGKQSSDHNYSDDNKNKHKIHNKCESLDEGTFAFMHWMSSGDKKSLTSDNPIVLMKFVNDKHTVLYDTDIQSEIYIEIENGVPYCKRCKSDDCSHVGFAICIEQLYGYRRGCYLTFI